MDTYQRYPRQINLTRHQRVFARLTPLCSILAAFTFRMKAGFGPHVPLASIDLGFASSCISQDAVADHFWRLLHSALAMVTIFLATAVMMTLCGFPALRMRA